MGDVVVLGLQWGDEGKGKLVDELAAEATAVVRFQGGANAGHTVWVDGRSVVLHQVPTGALRPAVRCIIAAGCVVDPRALRSEAEDLGLEPGERLLLSTRAQVVLPWFPAIDAAEEALRGAARVGTTGLGIGPAYAAKAARWGLTVAQWTAAASDPARLGQPAGWARRWLTALGAGGAAWSADDGAAAAWLQSCSGDDLAAIAVARQRGMVVFEGQLGLMRDPDRGVYPFTSGGPVLPPLGLVAPGARVLGVAKPYVTAVGAGPLPTEVVGAAAALLREQGREFGATTGRPRRVGWLDLPALRYAVQAGGATALALQMKLDGLRALGRMPVCVRYAGWDERDGYPQAEDLTYVRPVYAEWDPYADPRELARRIADAAQVPLAYVGTGAARGAALWP